MAPLSMGAEAFRSPYLLTQFKRGLGNTTAVAPSIVGTSQTVTKHQGYILQCLALSFSVISVASAVLTFYWFTKMRRSFRHE